MSAAVPGRRLANSRGAAAVELALAAPVMVALLVGLLELGQMLWINHTLQQAADSTARYAVVSRITDPTVLSDAMTARLQSTPGSEANVTVTPSVQNGISYLEIAGRLPYAPLGGITGMVNVTLAGRAVIPVTGGS